MVAPFVSTGPLLVVRLGGKMPGEEVQLPAGGGWVELSVWLCSITPLASVTVIFNGQAIDEIPLSPDRKSTEFRKRYLVTTSGWFHVRAEGKPEESYPLDTGFAQAFTSPIWVRTGNRPVRDWASAQYTMQWIDKLKELAEADPGWRSQWEKDHVFAQFDEARRMYEGFAREAQALTDESHGRASRRSGWR